MLVYLSGTGRCTEQYVSFCVCVRMSLCVVCAAGSKVAQSSSLPLNVTSETHILSSHASCSEGTIDIKAQMYVHPEITLPILPISCKFDFII